MTAIFFSFCASAPILAYDGVVSVGSVTAAPGEQAAVPVYLSSNNIEIASLTVPLQFSSTDLEVDSISFIGTLIKSGMSPLIDINNGSRFVRFTYYPGSEVITESEGLLATIYFSAKGSAPDQSVAVDSVNKLEYAGPPELWTRVEVADTSGLNLFFPDFASGEVTIQAPLDADYDQFSLPNKLALGQNFPNPFNPSTTISFSIPERSHVTLKVFNILGQEVETLLNETINAGAYETIWDASNQASGIYFYRLRFENQVMTKKMALLK
jgi:hypothetical protein